MSDSLPTPSLTPAPHLPEQGVAGAGTPGRARVLVAARASTALRIARAVRQAGLAPVGVVTAADRDARWAWAMDDLRPVSTYDSPEELVAAAQAMGASLLHPGVGFAAESPQLAQACEAAGLVWIGPQAATLERVANKLRLMDLARSLGIPTPRTLGPIRSATHLREALEALGGQGVLKAVQGGGGRGVTVLTFPDQAATAWERAQGLGPLLVQEVIGEARHLEVQVMADAAGHLLTLGTRECSVQRRAQKIVEEAPAPGLSAALVADLEAWTRRLCEAVDYRGVGTCEFLLTGDRAVLLEVNARLQVEHAVTEQVMGVDLVASHLRVAQGVALPEALVRTRGGVAATPLTARGHAMEARIYAEDPHTLLPASGTLLAIQLPPTRLTRPAAGSAPGVAPSGRATARNTATRPGEAAGRTGVTPSVLEPDVVTAHETTPVSPMRSNTAALSTAGEAAPSALATQATLPPVGETSRQATELRIERGLFPGDAARAEFSEPLVLVSAWAPSREEARAELLRAVEAVEVRGLPTLTPLISQVLRSRDFDQPVTTRWLESRLRPGAPGATDMPASAKVPAGPAGSAEPEWPVELRAPMNGVLVQAPQAGPVEAGAAVAVMEAMKMRLPVPAPARAVVSLPPLPIPPGASVSAGDLLATLTPAPAHTTTEALHRATSAHNPGDPLTAQASSGVSHSPVPEETASAPAGPTLPPDQPTCDSPATPNHGHARPDQVSPAVSHSPVPERDAVPGAHKARLARPSARERAEAFADPGSLREAWEDDAVLTAWASAGGREVALWVQDPQVHGGTIGLAGARRVASLIEQAARRHVPVVAMLDGGGARVQEGVDALAGVGLILAAHTRARGRCLQIGLVLGSAAGGAAYSPAMADLLIMVEGAGRLFLTGPAVLADSTSERTSAEELGGARLHATEAGTAHLTARSESAAFEQARRLLTFAPIVRLSPDGGASALTTTPGAAPRKASNAVSSPETGGTGLPATLADSANSPAPVSTPAAGTPRGIASNAVGSPEVTRRVEMLLPLLPGGGGPQPRPSDALAAAVVPADPTAPYDVRDLLRSLTDRGDFLELRPQWAPNVVTALARVDGVPIGVVATQPVHLAGALNPAASDKIAEHLRLCASLGLPLLTLVDTPGFLPGREAESAGTVRLGARVVAAYAGYGEAAARARTAGEGGADPAGVAPAPVPILTVVTRRAFGGAYVALGSSALAGAQTAAWPQARIGVMDARSAARLTSRRELAAVREAGGDAEALLAQRAADEEARQSAAEAARLGWIDEVIAPEHTRAWIAERLTEALTAPLAAPAVPLASPGSAPLTPTSRGPLPTPTTQPQAAGTLKPRRAVATTTQATTHTQAAGAPTTSTAVSALAATGEAHPAPALRATPLLYSRHPGDGWVACRCGSRHWGLHGAAGILIWRVIPDAATHPGGEASPPAGLEVLLQLRAPWTHRGGTWGLPGGAIANGEDAAAAALRECEEEAGIPAAYLRLGEAHRQDHGDWGYTTYTAQFLPDAALPGAEPLPCDGESSRLTWVPLTAVAATVEPAQPLPYPAAPTSSTPKASEVRREQALTPLTRRQHLAFDDRDGGGGSPLRWQAPGGGNLPLLPALAAVWDELAALLPQPGEL